MEKFVCSTIYLFILFPTSVSAICFGDPFPGELRGQYKLQEENDSLTTVNQSDESYTQGLRLSFAYETDCEPQWSTDAGEWIRESDFGSKLNINDPTQTQMNVTFGLGQHMFTPNNLENPNLIEDDRPYAGFLYGSLKFDFTDGIIDSGLTETRYQYLDGSWYGQSQKSLEFQVGIVGPSALGESAQSEVHALIKSQDPKGWDNQLRDEVGVLGRVTWRHRFAHPDEKIKNSDNYDITPWGTIVVGNVQTYLSTGVMFRYGKGISGFHTEPLTPVAMEDIGSIKVMVDKVCAISWLKECYVFVGAEGRYVYRNIFLDGSTFKDSHSVDKEPFVYDLMAGARLRWKSFTLDYAHIQRSSEFSPLPSPSSRTQLDGKHEYGIFSLSWNSYF